MGDNEDIKILVLAPTNKACDVLTKKLMDTNEDASWLARFVATGDEEIEKAGHLVDRNSEIVYGKCCVVSTIARLPYDGFKDWKLSAVEWDYIFIDEVSMIPLGQITYAIYRFEGHPIIISGDPMQIAPIVREDLWKDENIYTMVHLTTFDHPRTVERYDSMFGPKKLSGSPLHIYSVLLVVEFTKYLANNYAEAHSKEETLSIGIICPYKAEAQFINRLLEQTRDIPEQVTIMVGTALSKGWKSWTCDQLENIMFGRSQYIENTSYVTSHQMANVYLPQADHRYEVRIDEDSVDIQIGDMDL